MNLEGTSSPDKLPGGTAATARTEMVEARATRPELSLVTLKKSVQLYSFSEFLSAEEMGAASRAILCILVGYVAVGTSLSTIGHRPMIPCFVEGKQLPLIVQNRDKICFGMTKMQLAPTKKLRIEIGNTYAPIPSHLAELSRSSQKKVHDWTLFAQPVDPRHAALISKV
jgi:hypothetical protein